jgi:hypothetical protein
MKKLTIIAGLLLASTSIFAQSHPIKLSLRGSLTLPTGDWKLGQTTGGLLEFQANKSLSDNFNYYFLALFPVRSILIRFYLCAE